MLSLSSDFEEDLGLKPFEVRETTKIDDDMKKVINNAVDLTCLERGDCILLLKSFKWNVNKMNDVYYDDSEKYLLKAGTQFREIDPPEEIECEICCDTTTEPIGLACGHYFCKSCWKEHIKTRFGKGIILDCPCMSSGCKCLITHDLIKQVSTVYADRYWFFLKKDFVESQGNVFCPNPNCGRAIIILSSERSNDNIVCLCKQRFCCKCLGEFHSPVTCEDLREWNAKSTKDDEEDYLLLTAKPCYHCGLLCERTHGCNHMTCPKCKGEWCWMCRGDWKTHGEKTGGFYSCNIYNAGGSKGNEIDKKAESKKAEHERFMHYFDRWMDHNSLLRQSREKKVQNEKLIYNKFKDQGRVISRILDAFDTLILARAWLKNSYIYAYYKSERNGTDDFFNYQQGLIEHTTEGLGEVLFKPVDTYDPEIIANKASCVYRTISNFS